MSVPAPTLPQSWLLYGATVSGGLELVGMAKVRVRVQSVANITVSNFDLVSGRSR